MIKGTALTRTKIEFDGTSEELIEIAEEMSEGLDSHDLGDAMGFFIFHASLYNDFEVKCSHPCMKHTLRVTQEHDLFEWEGIED